jgi:hypothetical protein
MDRSEIAAKAAAAELLGEIGTEELQAATTIAGKRSAAAVIREAFAFTHRSRVGTAGFHIRVLENEIGIDTSKPGEVQHQRTVKQIIDVSSTPESA